MTSPIFMTNDDVKLVLNWPLVNESVEQAMLSVLSNEQTSADIPYAFQNPRTFTPTENKKGVMLTMPGFVGNHKLTLGGQQKRYKTLACKLVTCVKENEFLVPPKPTILANIMLLNAETGQLECVMDGTLITVWRTASASIVATKHIFFRRNPALSEGGITLGIVGCGVQGRIHAEGMCSSFKVNEVCLWNRTPWKAEALAEELNAGREKFIERHLKVKVKESVDECVAEADVIVVATSTSEPLLHLNMLKKEVHINAVGAGLAHYSELAQDIYDVASVYIDHWAGANVELKGLKTNIVCEVGELIDGKKSPAEGLTVFQSMGMAAEDATVAQAVYQHLKSS